MARSVQLSYRALLLASVAGLAWSGAAQAANLVNNTPQSGPGTQFNLGAGDSLTNTSSITVTAPGGAAPAVRVSPVSAGTIGNSGTINTFGSSGTAISVGGTLGTLSNSGLIAADGDTGRAIDIPSGGSIGALLNLAGGTISANGANGIAVNVIGNVGSFGNSGLIRADGSSGAAVAVTNSGSVGALTNSSGGVIEANGTSGTAVLVGGSSIGTLTNSGTIGVLTNSAGGVIQATGTSGSAVMIAAGNIGTLTNAGTITSAGSAAINSFGAIGTLVNSGTILAPAGIAIALNAGSGIAGGITNTSAGFIQGGPANGSGVAIDNSSNSHALTINTGGTVVGGIRLGAFGDTLNVTGGRITGAITGQGTTDTLNFTLANTGSFATGGSISGVSNINVQSGVVNFQTSVASALAFTVASSGTAVLNPGAPISSTSFRNAGAVNVGSGTASITGNYTQTGSGTLKVTITNSAAGRLNVSGTSSIATGGTAVSAHVPLTVIINPLIGQTQTVFTAGALTISGTGSPTVVSDSVALDFNLTSTATSLLLTGRVPTFNESLAAAIAAVNAAFGPANALLPPTSNDLEAQRFLANVLAGLGATGNGQLTQTLLSVITALTPTQLAQLEKQIVPNSVSSSNLNFLSSVGSFGTGAGNIFSRLSLMRSLDTGLAAGDEAGRGIQAWVQPFGSFLNQDAKEGLDSFSMSTYGATLGGDMLVTPELRVGLALTLANNDVHYNGFTSGSKASTFSVQLGLYGVYYMQNFFMDGLLSFGHNKYSSHTPISAFGVTRDADYGGTQLGAKIGAGYDIKFANSMVLTPYASVQQLHLNFDSYTTTGAFPFDMHVASQSADITQTSLGGRLAYPLKLSMGTLLPEIHVNWFHNFGSDRLTTSYTTSDVTTPGAFTFVGPHGDRDTFNIGVGATLARTGNWTFGGGYDYAGRSSSSQHLFYLRAKYSF